MHIEEVYIRVVKKYQNLCVLAMWPGRARVPQFDTAVVTSRGDHGGAAGTQSNAVDRLCVSLRGRQRCQYSTAFDLLVLGNSQAYTL